MKLPNSDKAIVPQQKIVGFLLAPDHAKGRSRAKFFTDRGFSSQRPDEMRDALIRHGQEHDVARTQITPHGIRYIIDGEMAMPNGVVRGVRTVWQIDTGTEVPGLVTAFSIGR